MPPDSAPATMALAVVGANVAAGRHSSQPLSPIRKAASSRSSQTVSTSVPASPPRMANSTEGTPSLTSRWRSMPARNRPSLLRLLARWNSAVMPSTDSKSKKKLATGTKNTDEPNPPTVPATSASRARDRNSSARSIPKMSPSANRPCARPCAQHGSTATRCHARDLRVPSPGYLQSAARHHAGTPIQAPAAPAPAWPSSSATGRGRARPGPQPVPPMARLRSRYDADMTIDTPGTGGSGPRCAVRPAGAHLRP